jgi:hypothetical protein
VARRKKKAEEEDVDINLPPDNDQVKRPDVDVDPTDEDLQWADEEPDDDVTPFVLKVIVEKDDES